MALVFQYGSNTSERRLNSAERLRGDARPLGAFQTEATYRLEFTVWSKTNNCAASNIAAAPDRRIWGVLYEIPDALLLTATSRERRSMEAIEGPRYRAEDIRLLDREDTIGQRPVITFVVKDPVPGLRTSLEYVGHILFGLWSFNVPNDYTAYVIAQAVANNPELAPGIAAM